VLISQTTLEYLHVQDVMHTGILTTDPSTPLRVLARLMAERGVHAVAAADPADARRPWGIVTDRDVATAAAGAVDETACEAITEEVVTISAAEPLTWAARQMVGSRVSHLVVVDPATGQPTGILSTLDIAAAYAG
jgi:CBS domain-containing protein